jgi:plastocyanin
VRRRALAAALVVAAVLVAPAAGQHAAGPAGPATLIAQGFQTFEPPVVDVVTGDVVRWENQSVREHTATANDQSWDSGDMLRDDVFDHRFDAPGEVPFFCRQHPGMTGTVRVHDALLEAPPAAAAPGRAFPLRGRTATPRGTVAIEADEGAGFARVATATADETGHFTASIVPRTTATYRAVAGDRPGNAVQLLVVDRKVAATVAKTARRLRVAVTVTPPSPGATVVLQLQLRHRFGWWPVARARLDRSSRARLEIPLRHRPPARVQLTLPDGATALGSSGVLRLSRRASAGAGTPAGRPSGAGGGSASGAPGRHGPH